MKNIKGGAKVWYIPDGWLPFQNKEINTGFEGHEAIIILNCQEKDAEIMMDIYFEDKDPIKDIKLVVQAKRVKCFRIDHPEEINGVKIDRLCQYAMRFKSNIEVIIQYGRMDISQPNLAYIGTIPYSE